MTLKRQDAILSQRTVLEEIGYISIILQRERQNTDRLNDCSLIHMEFFSKLFKVPKSLFTWGNGTGVGIYVPLEELRL